MPALQVRTALGRGRGHGHIHGRDDRVRACGGGFLGGVVRAVSGDLARARRPRRTSRGASQGRKGRCRREPRTGYQVWRSVDPVARRDPGREGGRPSCRRTASRGFGAAVGASARRLNSPHKLERAPWSGPGRLSSRTARSIVSTCARRPTRRSVTDTASCFPLIACVRFVAVDSARAQVRRAARGRRLDVHLGSVDELGQGIGRVV